MAAYSTGYYFLFHGHPPAAFVSNKDGIVAGFLFLSLALYFVGGFHSQPLIRKIIVNWLLPFFVVACAYCWLDFARAGSLVESLHSLRDLLMPISIAVMGIAIGSRKQFAIGTFVIFFAILSIPILLSGFYQHFFFTYADAIRFGLIDDTRHFFGFVRTSAEGEPIAGIRSFGIFDAPIGMALFCSAALFNSVLGTRISKAPQRWLHQVVVVLAATVLMLTFVRATFVGALLGWLLALRVRGRYKLLLTVVLGSASLLMLARLTLAGTGFDPSTMGHLIAFADTFTYLAQKPWGYGISFAGTRATQVPIDGDYLNIILNVGPLGLLLFVRIYWMLVKSSQSSTISPLMATCASARNSGVLCLLVTMLVLMVYPTSASWIFHLWLGVISGVCLRPTAQSLTSRKPPNLNWRGTFGCGENCLTAQEIR
jgi:hypothetical protein